MLGYIFEWLVYKLFGRSFDKEDVYLYTAIWGVANLCISFNNHG